MGDVNRWLVLGLLFFSHGIVDFIFQSRKMVEAKKAGRPRGYFFHFISILAALIIFLHPFLSWPVAVVILFLSLTHLIVDVVGYCITSAEKIDSNPLGFVLDQLVHIAFILIAWWWLGQLPRFALVGFYSGMSETYFWNAKLVPLVVVANIYLYVAFGGAIFMRKFMHSLPFGVSKQEIAGMGMYIGILERIIILTFILYEAVAGVAFVLMAKSLARYQELNDKSFAEYYLVGTLLSTVLALLGGFFLYFGLEFI